MTVTTIALPVPFAVRAVNCYLLEGDPLTLIDPGADWPETLVELEASLEARGLRVEDVDEVHQRCVEQGLDVTFPPTDMEWNVREMHVRHPDGHVFRISRGPGEE